MKFDVIHGMQCNYKFYAHFYNLHCLITMKILSTETLNPLRVMKSFNDCFKLSFFKRLEYTSQGQDLF